MELGLKNHTIHGFWALCPYWHSSWTRGVVRPRASKNQLLWMFLLLSFFGREGGSFAGVLTTRALLLGSELGPLISGHSHV